MPMLEGLVSLLLFSSLAVTRPEQDLPPLQTSSAPVQIVAPGHPHFAADALEVAMAHRQFRAFFSERNGLRFDHAFAMLTDTMQSEISQADWSENASQTLALFGPTEDQIIVRTTWYVDPPSAPVAGHYIAFDFQGETAGASRYCGFVVFHRLASGTFRVTAMEENFVARETGNSDAENVSRREIVLPCYTPATNDLL